MNQAVDTPVDAVIAETEGRPLSVRLRALSRVGHVEGESEPRFAIAFLRGGLNRDGIAAQAAQHYLMYHALERAAVAQRASRGDDFAFWLPELHRLPSLAADLEHWLGADWHSAVYDRFATTGIMTYAARITEVAGDSLPHFVAHHYTRYLADLSGGQMIARMFRDSYRTDGDAGSTFYTFPEIADPAAYKDRYRALVDGAGFTPDEERTVLREVASAYWLNGVAGQDLEDRFAEYAEVTA
ncbi:heme oxygenase (biliverdin-producing) [Leucobacter luti]|uniref:Heme oxygenase n=1 Tax=Leucobacter luti TaxID=340320 RepID=A0A4Q7TUM7_9MICO|nr:biliverdin-producing heme oxygenase [Leucobacter luti]MBL3698280.1 biliverdin-producing heme oxygenase [Leucobacter luti]RZT64635.1 heme oxygenase [Leucobacter luti]